MIRRIELVKGIPRMSRRIFRSRGIVALDKDPRGRSNPGKCFPYADIACPRAYGGCAERTCLPVKFGGVVEVGGKFTLHVQTDGYFIKVPATARFRKSRVRGCDAP